MFNATLAELTSLEQLLSTIMNEEDISDEVIAKLWSVYSVSKKEILKAQRRDAIIVLSMLAKAKIEIVQEKIDLLLKIGLGSFGKTNFSLAKYTCITLQCLGGSKTKVKGLLNNDSIRLPMSHQIFHRLKQMIEIQTISQEW
ncbi:6179_t:CDS:2 [Acaulospora morrowiae]|uniref:6179_t:CDS:1 n=1 Tax=Acaulospora morrowiae TaxID=94023 RepID=A0A9N9EYW6_9GLOM|nr:6179_t:CDS:2 [Acaulospora morrowiae]